MNILLISKGVTSEFATNQLKRYLQDIIVPEQDLSIIFMEKYSSSFSGIWLGLDEDFKSINSFTVEDKLLDDAIYINVIEGNGIIAGSNERSILIGVYKFLQEIGCKFIRPGRDGEVIPQKTISDICASVCHIASYRHRGIVIEGANSYENVAELIDWMPKLGYNSYFIQFREPYSFFRNWYCHLNNPTKEAEEFTLEDSHKIVKDLELEIKKRGILYHTVGHGWTSESLGIPTFGWDIIKENVSEEKKRYLAQINGRRDFFKGVPLNTNLCYSNSEVLELMSNAVLSYSKDNPSVDYVHVWLADEYNNHCECEECKKLIPTDFYIQLLNIIDEKLEKEGINTRIVFLIYLELLWAPQKEKIKNLDRFILMFAPISRTFSKSYAQIEEDNLTLPEYKRNKVVLPSRINENIAFLRTWQLSNKVDSFDFDYHLGRAHYGDVGYYEISRIISEDMKYLDKLGLNGCLSCQEQRAFMPTSLPNYIMGLTLWDKDSDFETEAKAFFNSAFGIDGEKVLNYLKTLSEIFDTDYWFGIKKWENPEVANAMSGVEDFVKQFIPIIKANIGKHNPCLNKSWKYLEWHSKFAVLFSRVLESKAKGVSSEDNNEWINLKTFLHVTEDEVQEAFDVFRFLQISKNYLKLK